MKKIFVALVALSLALIIGCQENLLNEPEYSLDKKSSDVRKDILNICCRVQDPLAGNCTVNGCVAYVHKVVNRAMNPNGLYEVSLHLEMDSELCSPIGMVHLAWKINAKSDDIIYVSEEGIVLVEKSYKITNREDVLLLVRYLVTTDGVRISQINLAQIEK
jgi:hypothetical protein